LLIRASRPNPCEGAGLRSWRGSHRRAAPPGDAKLFEKDPDFAPAKNAFLRANFDRAARRDHSFSS